MACLSSRFPYGTEITRQRLQQVGKEKSISGDWGFSNCACATMGTWLGRSGGDEIERLLNRDLRRGIVIFLKRIALRT